MPLTVGVNTLASLSEAEDFFALRLNADAWEDADEKRKERSLATATQAFNALQWTGSPEDEEQETVFPRVGSYFCNIAGTKIDFTGTPNVLKRGFFELSLHLLENEDVLSETGGLDDLEIGPVKLKGIRSASKLPSNVYRSIEAFLLPGGTGSRQKLWWRAN